MSGKLTVLSLLDAKDIKPMDKEMSEMFVKTCLLEQTRPDLEFDETMAKEAGFLGMVMFKRFEAQEVKVSLPVVLTTIMLSHGVVGNVVMWAYTLNRLYNKKRAMVTMDDLAETFPMGFPTEEEEDRIWEAQKTFNNDNGIDNLLDRPETWELDGQTESAPA